MPKTRKILLIILSIIIALAIFKLMLSEQWDHILTIYGLWLTEKLTQENQAKEDSHDES